MPPRFARYIREEANVYVHSMDPSVLALSRIDPVELYIPLALA